MPPGLATPLRPAMAGAGGAMGGITRPHRMPAAARWPSGHVDGGFTFVLFVVTLFSLQIGGLVLIYAATVSAFLAFRWRVAAPALARCAPIFLLPLYALSSTFWSVAPATTVYYGTEYLLTVLAAILIGAATGGQSALKGMFAAFFLWASANLLAGILFGDFARSNPFVGLAGSKNAAGDAAALGLIIAVAMLGEAWRRRWPVLVAAGVALLLIEGAIIVAAQSAGAIIAGGIGVLAVIGWTASRILPIPARTLMLMAMIAVAVIAATTQQLWAGHIFDDLLAMSGKDATLTGRTYIWGRAHVLISQRPWLGLGYSAFWRIGTLEPEAIWRKLLIGNRSGFHFHNSAYDILVALGYVGLALFALIFLVYVTALLLRTMRHADTEGIFFASVLLSYVSRAPFESFGTGIFHQSSLLLFGALAWATRPAERRVTVGSGGGRIATRTSRANSPYRGEQ
jgi:exopolysaccharide production protein ExoQ